MLLVIFPALLSPFATVAKSCFISASPLSHRVAAAFNQQRAALTQASRPCGRVERGCDVAINSPDCSSATTVTTRREEDPHPSHVF